MWKQSLNSPATRAVWGACAVREAKPRRALSPLPPGRAAEQRLSECRPGPELRCYCRYSAPPVQNTGLGVRRVQAGQGTAPLLEVTGWLIRTALTELLLCSKPCYKFI